MLRRTDRKRRQKVVFSPKQVKKTELKTSLPSTSTNPNNSETDTDTEEEFTCTGCNNTKAIEKSGSIECSKCAGWWHCCCAGISEKDLVKYTKYKINYCCPFCVIRKENILPIAEKLINCNSQTLSKNRLVEGVVTSHKQSTTKDYRNPESTENKDQTDLVLVIDNVENPDKFSDSRNIRKQISQKGKGNVKLSYKLPLGGIALHFDSVTEKKEFQERDSKEVFGIQSSAHNPAKVNKDKEIIGFAKNIPINTDLEELKDKIESQSEANISEIHRLKFWDTKRPMRVIKIKFDSPEDLVRGTQTEISDVIPDQKIKIERKRPYKFVRCYNCQRLGHSAFQCQSTKHCFNCGSDNCSESWCTKPSACRNCSGNHKSSSSKCPAFIQFVNKSNFNNSI